MCGEKYKIKKRYPLEMGSPPHVRGKEYLGGGRYHVNRITPACAGKRCASAHALALAWDHPRMCGEKRDCSQCVVTHLGSPPHVRGKVMALLGTFGPVRITPAYAGKSHKVRLQAAGRWDHPRVCGEKCAWPPGCGSLTGSPPRMRGKEASSVLCDFCRRITPAYAGKRVSIRQAVVNSRDHPRVCGEKWGHYIGADYTPGSPPRMRGKVVLLGREAL